MIDSIQRILLIKRRQFKTRNLVNKLTILANEIEKSNTSKANWIVIDGNNEYLLNNFTKWMKS